MRGAAQQAECPKSRFAGVKTTTPLAPTQAHTLILTQSMPDDLTQPLERRGGAVPGSPTLGEATSTKTTSGAHGLLLKSQSKTGRAHTFSPTSHFRPPPTSSSFLFPHTLHLLTHTMFASLMRLFGLATLLLAALARAQTAPDATAAATPNGLTRIQIKNDVQAEGGCIATVEGPACGTITIQSGGTATHALCKPERASIRCVGPPATGPKVFQCDARLTGRSANYAVEGFSFAAGGGDARCTLVRN